MKKYMNARPRVDLTRTGGRWYRAADRLCLSGPERTADDDRAVVVTDGVYQPVQPPICPQ
jgi:hypothetical protein